jgi:hypothetical protein
MFKKYVSRPVMSRECEQVLAKCFQPKKREQDGNLAARQDSISMPLQLNIKSRPTCAMLVGHFFIRMAARIAGEKKPSQGRRWGKVSRIIQFRLIDESSGLHRWGYARRQRWSDFVSPGVICDKVWQAATWPGSANLAMLAPHARGEKR